MDSSAAADAGAAKVSALSAFMDTNLGLVIAVVVLAHVAVIGWLFISLYGQTPKQQRMTRRFVETKD
jgi:threonine/homoserine/homoserine lactone efflux protein